MRKSYEELMTQIRSREYFERIRDGIIQGHIREIVKGDRPYSMTVKASGAVGSPHEQDPSHLRRMFHLLVGDGLITNAEIDEAIGELLVDDKRIRLGLGYIYEYITHYKNDDWYPTHPWVLGYENLIALINKEKMGEKCRNDEHALHFMRWINDNLNEVPPIHLPD